jgi:Leucine-rich repeat (LRR) protein
LIFQVLIVVGNLLRELPANLFGLGREMWGLKELDLAKNGIKVVHGKTFHHTPALETLILSFNELESTVLLDHPRLFSNLGASLKSLHLTGAWAQDSNQW